MTDRPQAPQKKAEAGAVGTRLIEAFEAYMSSASTREDSINKLLVVMARLSKQLADATEKEPVQRPAPDMSPLIEAVTESMSRFTDTVSAAGDRFTDTASTAGDQLADAVTALSATLASQEPPSAPQEPLAHSAEMAEAIRALAEAVNRQEERLDQQEKAGSALEKILERQNETNETLLKYLEGQSRYLADMDAKRLPEHSDEERRGDLVFHPYEEKDLAFLKESEVFGALSDDTLSTIIANGSLDEYEAGKTMFVIGDPVAEVYIVKSGIVEICRPTDDPDRLSVVAYLTAGDSIGEMSIFISGDTRSSIARVPEGATVLVLTFEVFMKLFKALPELALRLSSVFARRLKTSIKKERIQKRHRELRGDLQYFELPTVVQTLISSDERTGTLTVYDDEQEVIAELFFDSGRIRFARLGHLQGEEAFYQLFQTSLSMGTFVFREGNFPEGFDQGKEITTPGMSLIFEAARLSDELEVLRKTIPDTSRALEPVHATLQWTDDATRTLANGIWSMVRRKSTIADILDSLPRSHYAIYSVLAAMLQSGQIQHQPN